MARRRLLSWVALAAGAWAASSCAPSGFADEENIGTIRILATRTVVTRSDQPVFPEQVYARPGDQVTVAALAVDARSTPARPIPVFWLPQVCEDPPNDAYFSCFSQVQSASFTGDGGAAGDGGSAGQGSPGVGGSFPSGVALPVPNATSFQFRMPADAVTSHVPVAGTAVPYGLAIVFNIACAGHLELLPRDPGNDNPVQTPVGCFDADHNQLGPDDFVFGFSRVYAFDSVTNTNPVIDHVDVEGSTIPAAGFSTNRCTASRRADCPHVHIGPVVPSSSWELNPQEKDANGNTLHEEIWADFYTTFGQFTDSARLLYDAATGSLGGPGDTDDQFLPPNDPGDGFIWIVVHDSRSGASWQTVPVHVN